MKKIIKIILGVNWFRYLRINFSKKVKKDRGCHIYPYWGSKIKLGKQSSIFLKSNFYFGLPSQFANTKKSILILDKNASMLIQGGDLKINRGGMIKIEEFGTLSMGSGAVAEDLFLNAKKSITIGNGFLCSRRVTIRDNDGHSLFSNGKTITPKAINIGNDVWICQEAMVLKGVSIGDGSVIGARALITKEVSSGAICVSKTSQFEINNSSWKR